jgi:hypothetical protein
MSTEPRTQPIVVAAPKSVGLAVILTVLFGPLGMLYSTVIGGVIMLVASLILAVVTFGFGAATAVALLSSFLGTLLSELSQKMGTAKPWKNRHSRNWRVITACRVKRPSWP